MIAHLVKASCHLDVSAFVLSNFLPATDRWERSFGDTHHHSEIVLPRTPYIGLRLKCCAKVSHFYMTMSVKEGLSHSERAFQLGEGRFWDFLRFQES